MCKHKTPNISNQNLRDRISPILMLCSIVGSLISPYTASASTWSPAVLVNTESFHIIDSGDDSTDMELKFGDTDNERLVWERSADRFSFTNDLQVAGSITATGAVNTPEMYNSAGDLKVMPDVQGDVTLFGDTDVDNADAGKQLWIYRKATEFDSYTRFYTDASGHAHWDANLGRATGYLSIGSNHNMKLQTGANGPLEIFDGSAEGETESVTIGGFKTGDALRDFEMAMSSSANDTFNFSGVGNLNLIDMNLTTTGSISSQFDSAKHYFGASDDYSIEWDGSDAVHTISAGDFTFVGDGIVADSLQSTSGTILTINPDAINDVTLFEDITYGQAVANNPSFKLYDYYTATASDGDPVYVEMYIDPQGRFTFGGSTWATQFAHSLYLQGLDDAIVFGSYGRFQIMSADSQASANSTPFIYMNSVDSSHTSTAALHIAQSSSYDFGHPFSYNPKIYLHSENNSQTEWMSFEHDQTNAEIATGVGNLILSPAANVGIGTSNPTAKLEVLGTMSGTSLQVTGTGAAPLIFADVTTGNVKMANDSSKLYFGTSDDASITYDGSNMLINPREVGSGFLGVNESSPQGIIHATEQDLSDVALFERDGRTSDTMWIATRTLATKTSDMGDDFGSGHGYYIQDDAGVLNLVGAVGATRNGADNTGKLKFFTYTGGAWTNSFEMEDNRIAIPNDSSKLYFGAGDDAYIEFDGNSLNIKANSVTSTDTLNLSSDILIADGTTDRYLYWGDNNIGQPVTDLMSGGRHAKLGTNDISNGGFKITSITDANEADGAFRVQAVQGVVSPTGPGINLGAAKSDGGTGVADLAAAETVMQIKNNSTNLITILGSGNLGIGAAAPENKLEVVGSMSGTSLQITGTGSNPLLFTDITTGNVKMENDNSKLYFGATNDASITYDATNLVLNPQEVGTGYLDVRGTKLYLNQLKAIEEVDYSANNNNWFFAGAGNSSVSGYGNYGIGERALESITSGDQNFAMGSTAGQDITEGNRNFMMGPGAGSSVTVGHDNVALGWSALYSNNHVTGGNVAIGRNTLGTGTNTTGNVAIGYYAGYWLSNSYNTFIGRRAGYGTGYSSDNYAGYGVTAIGRAAGEYGMGSYSLALGAYAGKYESGSNTIIVDTLDRSDEATQRTSAPIYGITHATPSSQSLTFNVGSAKIPLDSGKLYFGAADDYSIEWDGSDAVHTISAGDFSFTGGNVGLGTATPENKLEVLGSMSGTSLQVTGTGANPLFFTDITTGSGRIGIGTNSPATSLHVAGTMPEHMIQSDIGLNFSQVTRPPAFTASLVAEAGNNDIGNGYYYVSYTTVLGETELSTHTGGSTTGGQLGGLVVSVAGQQQADISVTASTDYRVTGIRIYRSYTTNHYNDVRIVYEAPNTTGTYRVNLADASKTGPSNSYTRDNTTNSFVTVNGSQVMRFSEKNTFFGYQAGESITTGSDNAFFGYQAGGDSTTVSQSVCVGSLCAASGQLSASVAIGYDALRSVTSNSPYSVAIGHQAMRNRANGSRSIGIGRAAATDNDGSYNIFLGDQAGRYITGGSTKNESSDYGVYIGADAKASISDAQNEIAIGYDVTGSGSNTVIIGNDSITDTFLRGNVNISETGNLNFTGAAGLILPVYTDATRPTAGTAGMVIFNSDDNFLNVDDGSNWRDMSGNVT